MVFPTSYDTDLFNNLLVQGATKKVDP